MQAMILDPFGKLATYSPLVIDSGSTPAIPPVSLSLLPGSVVGIFGGGNDDLTILDNNRGACTNGTDGKFFGQVFFCGTGGLFRAVEKARIHIPGLGVDGHGEPCPSVRSFDLVDQDQSDNVQTSYLTSAQGSIAQDNTVNRRALGTAGRLINGSDNTLLLYVDTAIGCQPWLIPDLTDGGRLVPTQATDELQAAAHQDEPVALIPAGDPMVGPGSLELLNAYRVSVDQPAVNALGQASTRAYCAHLEHTQLAWINAHRAALITTIFPVSGTDLYQFMLQRYQASLQILGCQATTE